MLSLSSLMKNKKKRRNKTRKREKISLSKKQEKDLTAIRP
jgi:hypothetical protein